MSRSNWLQLAALAGLAFIVVSFCVLGWLYISSYQRQHAEQRQEAANYKPEQAREQRQTTCVDIAKRTSFPCVVDAEKSTDGEKYTEYDLKAQQEMAEWALGMFLVSFLGVVVTGAATFYVALTLNETRRMARAAEKSIIDNREIGEGQATSYLTCLEMVGKIDGPGETPVLQFKLENTGHSPAFGVHVSAKMHFDLGWPPVGDIEGRKPKFVGSVGQGKSTKLLQMHLLQSVRDIPAPPIGDSRVGFVVMDVTWMNVFRRQQRLMFRYTFAVSNYSSGNRSVRVSESGIRLAGPAELQHDSQS